MTVDELVHTITTDLEQIADWLRWAHTEGFHPAGPRTTDPADRPPDLGPIDPNGQPITTDTDLRPAQDAETSDDPDHIRAPRYDIGQADHRTRQAWRRATKALTAADDELVMAAWCCGHRTQPPPGPTPDTTAEADHLVATIRARLDLCDTDNPPARHRLTRARRHIDTAWRTLHAALERGRANPDDQAVGDMCVICRIRDAADKTGGRCNTCHAWKRRNGYERPTRFDDDVVDQAKAAQARRLARGEGWGDEGLSCASDRPILVLDNHGDYQRLDRASASDTAMVAELELEAAGLQGRVDAGSDDLIDRKRLRAIRTKLARLRAALEAAS